MKKNFLLIILVLLFSHVVTVQASAFSISCTNQALDAYASGPDSLTTNSAGSFTVGETINHNFFFGSGPFYRVDYWVTYGDGAQDGSYDGPLNNSPPSSDKSSTFSHTYSSPGVYNVTVHGSVLDGGVGYGCTDVFAIQVSDIVTNPDLGTICVASNIPTSWNLNGPSGTYSYTFPAGNFSCQDDLAGEWSLSDVPEISGYNGPYFSPSSLSQTVSKEGFIGWDINYQPIVNTEVVGSCGPAAKVYPVSQNNFSGSFCTSGDLIPSSPTFPNPGTSTSWKCVGQNGGADASCFAGREALVTVSGKCGTADRVYGANETSFGSDAFCSVGDLSPAPPTFPMQGASSFWQCLGRDGGADDYCQATRLEDTETLDVFVSSASGGRVTSEPSGIDCGASCVSTYKKNISVTLTATPTSSYWKFKGWGGDCSSFGISKNCTVSMDSYKSVTAKFVVRMFEYLEF